MVARLRLVPLVVLATLSLTLVPALPGGEQGVEDLDRICARLDAHAREAAELARRLEEIGSPEEAARVREEGERLLLVKRTLERKLDALRATRDAPNAPGPGMPPDVDPRRVPQDLPDDPPVVPGTRRVAGASSPTRAAVDLGLEWLVHHLDAAGFWDCDGFVAQCRLNQCDGPGRSLHDPGVTGLALLAFLGAGETHRHGRHKRAVKRAAQHLVEIQSPEGRIGPMRHSRFVYNHAIGALALAEAYARTGSLLFKAPAQKAVDYIHRAQNPYLAWRYGVRPGDNDTSVTAWMVAALDAAKRAGLRVDQAGFDGAQAWIEKVTEPEFGRVGYLTRGDGPDRQGALLEMFPPQRSESLTAMGITIRVLVGEAPEKSETIQKGAELLLGRPPVWDPESGDVDMYYWFWGSMAMVRVGGSPWERWNISLREALLDHQRKDGDEKGSWDPIGAWGREGGRVYSTAISILALETSLRPLR